MSRKLRIVYVAHSLRSDWNNGNAHFLRGLLRAMVALGHDVTALEPEMAWSIENLRTESIGKESLAEFVRTYPDLNVRMYAPDSSDQAWLEHLRHADVVILHEWNTPELAQRLVRLRDQLGFQLLFHDTHHRASSSPEQIALFELGRFNGILAFGQVLEDIYRERFGLNNVWILHEAADISIFRPIPDCAKEDDLAWIGNWGDDERSAEIREFLIDPVADLGGLQATIYGVRYPEMGLQALREAGIRYGGYLPNLQAPIVYASARLTVHIPRRQYASAMVGIPTIRVFEALACGIPLISAPWQDTEDLFRPGDLRFVANGAEMKAALAEILANPAAAQLQACRGLETVLGHHTCDHRAQQLTTICEGLLS